MKDILIDILNDVDLLTISIILVVTYVFLIIIFMILAHYGYNLIWTKKGLKLIRIIDKDSCIDLDKDKLYKIKDNDKKSSDCDEDSL